MFSFAISLEGTCDLALRALTSRLLTEACVDPSRLPPPQNADSTFVGKREWNKGSDGTVAFCMFFDDFNYSKNRVGNTGDRHKVIHLVGACGIDRPWFLICRTRQWNKAGLGFQMPLLLGNG